MGKNFRFNRLKHHQVGGTSENMELSIPAPTTPSGKVYRSCPDEDCVPGLFVLGPTDEGHGHLPDPSEKSRRLPGIDGTTCPYCGLDGSDDNYLYSGDVTAITKYIEWAAMEDVGEYMDDMIQGFNRQMKHSGGGFLDISMKVQKSHNPRPFTWREDLLRDITCHVCRTPYGVYATALFCTDCGHPNLGNHFQREVELIEQQIQLATRTY